MTFDNYEGVLLALLMWREARNQPDDARWGTASVAKNRVGGPMWRPTLVGVILQPMQFSSFNRDDPNSSRFPNPGNASDWQAFLDCCKLVDDDGPDPTGGATYYHSEPPGKEPAWADPAKMTAQIGVFKFYKL